jgi:hypothetical protein
MGRINLLLIVFFTLAIVGFWLLEKTTPGRIGSLVLLLLVCGYAVYRKRPDVIAICALFFLLLDVELYLFNSVLPIWLGTVVACVAIGLLWFILFQGHYSIFPVIICLLTVELMLIMYFINIEIKVQALMIILPFVLLSQDLSERSALSRDAV